MNAVRPRPGITHCSFAGCTIILDVNRDRYWRVGADLGMGLDWLVGLRPGPLTPDVLARLERLKLIESSAAWPRLIAEPLPPPNESAIDGDIVDVSLRFREAAEVALLCANARIAVRIRPLQSIVRQVRTLHQAKGGSVHDDIKALARRFKQHRSLVPLAGKCLPDSLAFLQFAARRGHFPNLVFGVEAWPFAAHCWVQDGDVVLNDVVDHARSFSPILTI